MIETTSEYGDSRSSLAGVRPLLAGRTALVVGTSPNIGTGIAVELARAGAAVCCVDHDPRIAKLAAEEVGRAGNPTIGISCDATDPEAVDQVLEQASAELGPIDVLVNGAVIYAVKGVLTMDFESWRRQMAVMLDSAFLFSSGVAKRLVSGGRPGAIVNVISTAGHQGEPDNIGYATAKGGLLNMTRSAAVELAEHGIRVNSLTPTATDPSEALERAARWGVPGPAAEVQAALAIAERQVPLAKLPAPSDYGKAAVFLCSADARMITGTDLAVDAGSLARYWRTKPAHGA
jgi:NAD(P)-dependent dehydrogenase (short-subunit alcohol dehydrogenase family)